MSDDTAGCPDDGQISPDTAITLSNPGELIAATPYALGFYPTHSIVTLFFEDAQLRHAIRVDRATDPFLHRRVVSHLVHSAHDLQATSVAVVIVGPPADDGALACVRDAFTTAGLPLDLFGTPDIAAGARWFDYDNPARRGNLPDPTTSIVAVHAVASGLATLPSREALAAQVAPAPDDVLTRRAALLEVHRANSRSVDVEEVGDGWVDWVKRRFLDRVADGDEAFSDEDIVQACDALTRRYVRDACLSLLTGPHAQAAERLWLLLTRHCPAPACAEPACLLAFGAYSRGDSALASVAVDRALAADPEHNLARLLRASLDHGMPPQRIRDLIVDSVEWIL
ncbi:DUF4192 domain-containing protein [Saccharothrix sp. NPDC042600]|uniref:DUF4192 domain-containing protein n=1 Tax=Saccharothrix TaxID=2071 RepID=UPI00340ECD37|nr:hypothetical protein GCM10017745_46540 [Saccharothrix mutabilis subsp. capreolus]